MINSKRKLILNSIVAIIGAYVSPVAYSALKNGSENKVFCPEDFGAKGDGINDDTSAIITCVNKSKNNTAVIKLRRQYRITKSIELPDGIHILGDSEDAEIIYVDNSSDSLSLLNVIGENVFLSDFKISYGCNSLGSIRSPKIIGIMCTNESKNCKIKKVTIFGNRTGKVGFTQCIRLMGTGHIVEHCNVQFGGICISLHGDNLEVSNNYVSNHFISAGIKPWSDKTPFWDGILLEGCTNCKILKNVVESCGQSGIYCGGNNTKSTNIEIVGNRVFNNWNRGIDIGVTGNDLSKSAVSNVLIKDNVVFNNREPQIWMSGITKSIVTDNVISITETYDHVFKGFFGGRVGIALGDTVQNKDNVIFNNKINLSINDTAAITVYGSGNEIHNNNMVGKGLWFKNNSVATENEIINNSYIK